LEKQEEFMQIDVAQEIEIDEMVALDALVSGNSSRRNLITQTVKRHQGYVARQENQIVGFLLMHEHFFELPFIELLLVHPSFRRQGIGTALIQHLEAIYTPGKLFTSTNVSNERMQRLCERLGYVRSGIIEHLDEDDPELFYFKRLSNEALFRKEETP
jgi:ribosomal protein S18 acetylase RimI-like enzyme